MVVFSSSRMWGWGPGGGDKAELNWTCRYDNGIALVPGIEWGVKGSVLFSLVLGTCASVEMCRGLYDSTLRSAEHALQHIASHVLSHFAPCLRRAKRQSTDHHDEFLRLQLNQPIEQSFNSKNNNKLPLPIASAFSLTPLSLLHPIPSPHHTYISCPYLPSDPSLTGPS